MTMTITFTGSQNGDALFVWLTPWDEPQDIELVVDDYINVMLFTGFSRSFDFTDQHVFVVQVKAEPETVELTEYYGEQATSYEVSERLDRPDAIPEEIWQLAIVTLHDFSCDCSFKCFYHEQD